jgi:glycosyltransferase involved in cell wall biosynthesis
VRICILAEGISETHLALASTPVLVYGLAKALRQAGHEPILVTPAGDVAEEDAPKRHAVHGQRHPGLTGKMLSLVRTISSLEPDVVHVHGDMASCYFARFLKQVTPYPVLVTLTRNVAGTPLIPVSYPILSMGPIYKHGQSLFEPLKRRLVNGLDHIVVMNHFMRSAINIGPEKISVVNYGLRDDWPIHPTEKAPEVPMVLFWGDGSTKRGFHLFLDCAIRTRNRDPRVMFSAALRGVEPEIVPHLDHALRKRALAQCFTSPIDVASMASLVASSSIVVLPFLVNSAEPPLTVVESMAQGRPVVTTPVGGNGELIENGATGHLVHPDADQLFEKIISLVGDANRNLTVGRQAQDLILKHYRWGRCVSEIIPIYESVVKR